METHPECVMVFNRILTFSQKKNAFIKSKQYNGKTGYVNNKDIILKGGLFVPTCSILFRNKLIVPFFSKKEDCLKKTALSDYSLRNIIIGSISSFLILNSGKDCKGWRSQFRSVAKE